MRRLVLGASRCALPPATHRPLLHTPSVRSGTRLLPTVPSPDAAPAGPQAALVAAAARLRIASTVTSGAAFASGAPAAVASAAATAAVALLTPARAAEAIVRAFPGRGPERGPGASDGSGAGSGDGPADERAAKRARAAAAALVRHALWRRACGAQSGTRGEPRLRRLDFEKDDDANGHLDFVAAASNLRAACYGIGYGGAMDFVFSAFCISMPQRFPLVLARTLGVRIGLRRSASRGTLSPPSPRPRPPSRASAALSLSRLPRGP